MTSAAVPPVRARERANRILREPRLLVLLLAGGVMATIVVFVIAFSEALYTASSSDAGSTVGAGEIQVTLSSTGELIDGTNLKPGATRTGTVTVTNAEEKAALTLRASNLVNTPAGGPSLADILYVKVTETAPQSVTRFNGRLRDLTTAPVALGTWAAGEARTFEIQVAWPEAQDSLTYASVKTTFGFDWKAASVQ